MYVYTYVSMCVCIDICIYIYIYIYIYSVGGEGVEQIGGSTSLSSMLSPFVTHTRARAHTHTHMHIYRERCGAYCSLKVSIRHAVAVCNGQCLFFPFFFNWHARSRAISLLLCSWCLREAPFCFPILANNGGQNG